jgi:hypothetical protein
LAGIDYSSFCVSSLQLPGRFVESRPQGLANRHYAVTATTSFLLCLLIPSCKVGCNAWRLAGSAKPFGMTLLKLGSRIVEKSRQILATQNHTDNCNECNHRNQRKMLRDRAALCFRRMPRLLPICFFLLSLPF